MGEHDLGPYISFQPEELSLAPNNRNRVRIRTVVCLYDANPQHHKNNLDKGITNEGEYRMGCVTCFRDLQGLVSPGNPSQFASVWRALSASERQTHIDNAESRHRTNGPIETMNDMKNELESGGRTWGNEWLADAKYPVTSVDDVIDKLRTVHTVPNGQREIHVVACMMHGVPDRFFLGGTIWNRTVARALGLSATDFVEQIKNYLAEDILWILYACGTAGLGLGNGRDDQGGPARLGLEITRGQEGGRKTVAAALHDALHNAGKNRAEVWGHTGYGVATQRPYWRRYRERGAHAVSLFEMCFNEAFVNAEFGRLGGRSANAVRAEMFRMGQFDRILRQALVELGPGEQGVRDIPLWSLVYRDPERTELPARCQAIWIGGHQRR
jgi:hypothetical protein